MDVPFIHLEQYHPTAMEDVEVTVVFGTLVGSTQSMASQLSATSSQTATSSTLQQQQQQQQQRHGRRRRRGPSTRGSSSATLRPDMDPTYTTAIKSLGTADSKSASERGRLSRCQSVSHQIREIPRHTAGRTNRARRMTVNPFCINAAEKKVLEEGEAYLRQVLTAYSEQQATPTAGPVGALPAAPEPPVVSLSAVTDEPKAGRWMSRRRTSLVIRTVSRAASMKRSKTASPLRQVDYVVGNAPLSACGTAHLNVPTTPPNNNNNNNKSSDKSMKARVYSAATQTLGVSRRISNKWYRGRRLATQEPQPSPGGPFSTHRNTQLAAETIAKLSAGRQDEAKQQMMDSIRRVVELEQRMHRICRPYHMRTAAKEDAPVKQPAAATAASKVAASPLTALTRLHAQLQRRLNECIVVSGKRSRRSVIGIGRDAKAAASTGSANSRISKSNKRITLSGGIASLRSVESKASTAVCARSKSLHVRKHSGSQNKSQPGAFLALPTSQPPLPPLPAKSPHVKRLVQMLANRSTLSGAQPSTSDTAPSANEWVDMEEVVAESSPLHALIDASKQADIDSFCRVRPISTCSTWSSYSCQSNATDDTATEIVIATRMDLRDRSLSAVKVQAGAAPASSMLLRRRSSRQRQFSLSRSQTAVRRQRGRLSEIARQLVPGSRLSVQHRGNDGEETPPSLPSNSVESETAQRGVLGRSRSAAAALVSPRRISSLLSWQPASRLEHSPESKPATLLPAALAMSMPCDSGVADLNLASPTLAGSPLSPPATCPMSARSNLAGDNIGALKRSSIFYDGSDAEDEDDAASSGTFGAVGKKSRCTSTAMINGRPTSYSTVSSEYQYGRYEDDDTASICSAAQAQHIRLRHVRVSVCASNIVSDMVDDMLNGLEPSSAIVQPSSPPVSLASSSSSSLVSPSLPLTPPLQPTIRSLNMPALAPSPPVSQHYAALVQAEITAQAMKVTRSVPGRVTVAPRPVTAADAQPNSPPAVDRPQLLRTATSGGMQQAMVATVVKLPVRPHPIQRAATTTGAPYPATSAIRKPLPPIPHAVSNSSMVDSSPPHFKTMLDSVFANW